MHKLEHAHVFEGFLTFICDGQCLVVHGPDTLLFFGLYIV